MEDHTTATLDNENGTIKRRLGRGLNALLGSTTDNMSDAQPEIIKLPAADEISVELLERNPFQPRTEFAEDGLLELAESIRQHGVLQPLLVRLTGDRYQLIAGERRWLAAQRAGLETVPCRLMSMEDQQVNEVAIEENLKRRDLGVLEKASAFRDYMNRFESTVDGLAKKLSMNRSTVSNLLRLLELPAPVKAALNADRITAGHARALLPLGQSDQEAMCRTIETEGWTVRQAEEAVRAKLKREPKSDESTAQKPIVSNHVISLQNQLREKLGLKVEIRLKSKNVGRVVVHFGSNDDFDRLFKALRSA
jgi:ParB family chromosome partitioning protein